MRFLIIGLGIYGSNLALDLTNLGHEVIGADNRPNNIEAIKDYISTVYQVDSTEESALNVLPLKNVDVVIVAIGENFGASIKTVALLKKLGVKCIYARAGDKIHESILQGFDVERILTPEQRAATDLSNEIELGSNVTSMKIDSDTYIIKFNVPEYFVGESYNDLKLEGENIKIIAVSRPFDSKNILGLNRKEQKIINPFGKDIVAERYDVITAMGTIKEFRNLYRKINQ